MKRFLTFLCTFLLMTGVSTGMSFADNSQTAEQREELSSAEVFELLSAVPDAVSSDVTSAQSPDDVLRAMSTLRFHSIDLDRVDESLLSKAQAWNRIVSSGIDVPSYAELVQTYETNAEFRQAIDTAAVTLSACTDAVTFVVIIAVGIWPLLIMGFIVACAWQLPGVSAWFTCTTSGVQRVSSAILASLDYIVTNCVPLAAQPAANPVRAGT